MIGNETILALSLGLIAAIGWGISGFFDAKSSRAVHPIVASFMVNGILTAIFVLCYIAFLGAGSGFSVAGVLSAAAGGAIIAIGALAYFTALRIGPVSLVSPMSSAYPLVTALLAVAIFGGVIRSEQGLAIGLIVTGILLATDFLPAMARRKHFSRGPVLGLLTALCWGVGYALVARGIRADGWQQATLVELIAMMLAFGACIPFLKERNEFTLSALRSAARNRNILLASTVALVACLSFNIGLSHDSSGGAIVATLSAFYPILTVVLALRHFEESVQAPQIVGAGMSIVGVIALAVL